MGKILLAESGKNEVKFSHEEKLAAFRLECAVTKACHKFMPFPLVTQVSLSDDGLVRWANVYVEGDEEFLKSVRVGVEKFANEHGCPSSLINIEKV